MKTKLLYPISLIVVPVALLLMSYSSGSPGGKTGSPADGATCTQCHTGTANVVSDWITTDIPASGYTPGETYTITANGIHNGVSKFGFELTAEDGLNQKTGTWVITDSDRTKLSNGNNAITHTQNGTTPVGSNATWSADWTAPTNFTGDVTFYAAFNAANGNGNTGGDVIYTTTLSVSESTVGIADDQFAELSVYPNPASNYFHIENAENASLRIFSVNGKMVEQIERISDKQQIDLQDYVNGMYILHISSPDQTITKKLYVNK